jgi:hypothetical protein
MGRRAWILLSLAASLTLAAIGFATTGNAAGPLNVVADMTGPVEVPPGDPDGSGEAEFALNQGQGTVCFELEVEDIAPATAAHIHLGAPGVAGPIVVPLEPPTDGSSEGCTTGIDPKIIKGIRKDPGNYYVNVHNADFPAGAVRGQLRVEKADEGD